MPIQQNRRGRKISWIQITFLLSLNRIIEMTDLDLEGVVRDELEVAEDEEPTLSDDDDSKLSFKAIKDGCGLSGILLFIHSLESVCLAFGVDRRQGRVVY
jgi:hypothetical protein